MENIDPSYLEIQETKATDALNQGEDGSRGPDFKRVHSDDLAGYQAAILKALNETHELHYDYRVWNLNQNRYLWTHIDATSEVQSDRNSLVYAIYTDITSQKYNGQASVGEETKMGDKNEAKN